MRKVLERDIQKSIKEWLQYKSWFVFKNHQSLGSHKGVADLVAMRGGRTLWLEVKTATGKLHASQEQFKKDVQRAGGEYYVVRSIEDVETVIALQGCEEAF